MHRVAPSENSIKPILEWDEAISSQTKLLESNLVPRTWAFNAARRVLYLGLEVICQIQRTEVFQLERYNNNDYDYDYYNYGKTA